jgi:glucose-6-phosphate isomerase
VSRHGSPATGTPARLDVNEATGRLTPATTTFARRLADMRGMYRDGEAEARLLADDPLIYEVFQYDVPERTGELFVCTTVLQPGRVGDEYFMTKGHFHSRRDCAETYIGLQGAGEVMMMRDERCETVALAPGTVAYVPPHYAHRTINTGSSPLVFLAVYPAQAGHDYASIEQTGFAARLVDRNGTPTLVDRLAPLS